MTPPCSVTERCSLPSSHREILTRRLRGSPPESDLAISLLRPDRHQVRGLPFTRECGLTGCWLAKALALYPLTPPVTYCIACLVVLKEKSREVDSL